MRRHFSRCIACLLLASFVLLLAACGQHPAISRSTLTPTTTPTLAWHRVSLPSGIDLSSDAAIAANIAISPVDGHNLWVIAPTGSNSFVIWATQDMGATWKRVSTMTPATAEPTRWAILTPSTTDPQTLAAIFSWGAGEAGTLRSISYLSTDGGIHWQQLAGDVAVTEVASVGGKTYALLDDTTLDFTSQSAGQAGAIGLVVSTDGLQSWRNINPAGLASNDDIFNFWLNPTTSEVLAATIQNTLWRTQDAGANWSRINTLNQQIGLGTWVLPLHQWVLCSGLQCSDDLGKTWLTLPTFSYTASCASCGKNSAPYSNRGQCLPSLMAANGSLLGICPVHSGTIEVNDLNSLKSIPMSLYQWMPGTSQLRKLGPTPGALSAVSATGQLWSLNAQQGSLMVAILPK